MNGKTQNRQGFDTFKIDIRRFRHQKLGQIKERLEYVDKYFKILPPPSEEGSFMLVIIEGVPAKWVKLEKEKTMIGRAEDADIQIIDPNISRIHCAVENNNRNLVIEDNNSRNSVFVNGEKISRRNLCDGDIIRIGDSELVFVKNSPSDELIFGG